MVFNVVFCDKIDFCFYKYNVCLKKISRKARSFFASLRAPAVGKARSEDHEAHKSPSGSLISYSYIPKNMDHALNTVQLAENQAPAQNSALPTREIYLLRLFRNFHENMKTVQEYGCSKCQPRSHSLVQLQILKLENFYGDWTCVIQFDIENDICTYKPNNRSPRD